MVDYEELPAVVDMLDAQAPGSVLVHDTVKRNVYLEVGFDGPIEAAAQTAPVKITRELRTARQVMSPIECRGFVAQWDEAAAPADPAWRDPVSPCGSHRARAGARVARDPISRDLARRGRRLRLQGDPRRRGDLPVLARHAVPPSGALARGPARAADRERNCREHHYALSAYADEAGRLLAFEAKAAVDSGAYSAFRSPRRSSRPRSARSCPAPM